MAKQSILIVEDDPDIRELLTFSLSREGWELLMAENGEAGLKLLGEHLADCVLLDIMLPGIDGLEVLRRIKHQPDWSKIPVIMASAKGEESDVVTGLELGADDYIVKPYSPKILAARIKTVMRRRQESGAAQEERNVWQQGSLKIDTLRHEAYNGEHLLDLSATEFAILHVFLSHPEEVFTRNKIISAIRGDDYPVTDRSVDVQILALRRKLGTAGDMIETVRGVGYRFKIQ
ncbi:response regulator transcription factor [Brucepastera parasyntrophica]|uniref:response regulator transcription factor n=1 Tax=Brucepastera parasyntrophica TaxID=2880008 RepID=UPI00210C95DF|nr:response regulator transcription factor [Brucepastera parasyntrophica]ULQ60666.1 response regulator transcription factor [Brucepastera parasyntrophica]